MADVDARIFRVLLEVADLERAAAFYSTLLDVEGRAVGGARYYFYCGDMILGLVDVSAAGARPQAAPQDIYFSVAQLEPFFERALQLKALSTGDVHGENAGAIVERPWGERSFYCVDPYGNGLCFVDEATLFTGKEES